MLLLTDPPQWLYILLYLGVVVTAAICIKSRERKHLKFVIIACLLLVVLFIIDYKCESPREEAVRRVKLMAGAATARNPDVFVEQVSSTFNYMGKNRNDLKTSQIWAVLQQYQATVGVWGFDRGSTVYPSDAEVEIDFYAKGEAAAAGGAVLRFVKARFVRDTDGAFRLKRIQFFNPADGGKNEDPIPGFP